MTRPRDIIDIADPIPLAREVELSPRDVAVIALALMCVAFTLYHLAIFLWSLISAVLS